MNTMHLSGMSPCLLTQSSRSEASSLAVLSSRHLWEMSTTMAGMLTRTSRGIWSVVQPRSHHSATVTRIIRLLLLLLLTPGIKVVGRIHVSPHMLTHADVELNK